MYRIENKMEKAYPIPVLCNMRKITDALILDEGPTVRGKESPWTRFELDSDPYLLKDYC